MDTIQGVVYSRKGPMLPEMALKLMCLGVACADIAGVVRVDATVGL